ncbi:MAG: type II toxin-antitoxin system HicB family antitoxin [Patescibacteria group bacterium]
MSKQYEYKIEYKFDSETKNVMAVIPELNNVSSFGKTFAEAEANIKEASECYLEALVKDKV